MTGSKPYTWCLRKKDVSGFVFTNESPEVFAPNARLIDIANQLAKSGGLNEDVVEAELCVLGEEYVKIGRGQRLVRIETVVATFRPEELIDSLPDN